VEIFNVLLATVENSRMLNQINVGEYEIFFDYAHRSGVDILARKNNRREKIICVVQKVIIFIHIFL